MKKMKVALSWLLALLMMVSMLTGFHTVSAATLDSLGIVLDDDTVTAVADGENAYTVKIPDGRPRVPQVSCAGADKVVQAFLPDTATSATATVTKGGQTYTITFVKDRAEKGFVLQYGDYYTWDPGFSGAEFVSSNTALATVDSNGVVVIKAVTENLPVSEAEKAITITATNGSQTATLKIDKTIRAVLSVWMLTGQSNAAISYYDMNTATRPAKGTAMYFGREFGTSVVLPNIIDMVTASGELKVASTDSALAKGLYDTTGEKVLMLNAGISGAPISDFVPGSSSSETWALVDRVMREAYAQWTKDSFQANYETRIRSYFFVQGCAEVDNEPEHWVRYFSQEGSASAVKNLDETKEYKAGELTWRTYMTEALGFDYCMNIMVSWRPVGIVTSTRTAQFQLEETYDDFVNVSRINQTFSLAEGTYRYDNLHYSQTGKNMLGIHAAANAVRVYQDDVCLRPATGATAYFNKIGYDDGETIFVQAGDFYNYCTRPENLSSDDHFAYKFEGADVVEYDGKNDFSIKTTATPGATAVMKIYSETDKTTPLTTLTIQVVGDRSDAYATVETEEYAWDFTGDEVVTTAGDITLTPAEDNDSIFTGNATMEMSRDLMLDSDGYWSIEWKSSGVNDKNMIFSSSKEYAKNDAKPNFVYMYYTNATGWQFFRDTAYTDYMWRTHSGSNVTTEHVYKLECRNNVYTFSIDGEMMESREIIEGHASYRADKTYNGAGYFDNVFNIHYLLGGVNKSGANNNYGHAADVSYIKIQIGDENPEIKKVNNYPYVAESGYGTLKSPYIISGKVAANTVIDASDFVITAPKGTVTMSAEKFGGTALESITCDAGTKSIYVMILGAFPYMSTYYKIDLTVSDDPDVMYYEVMADNSLAVKNAADGAEIKYTLGGVEKTFIKGKSLFTTISEAVRLVAEEGEVYIAAGTYDENVEINRDIVIKGAQAGVSPNGENNALEETWPNARADMSAETQLTGDWSITNDCTVFSLDGVTFTGAATFKDARDQNYVPATITWDNVIATDLTANNALSFGEASTLQSSAVTGKLVINNMRAYNLSKANLLNIALDDVTINASYFEGGSRAIAYRVPGVTDGATDHTASVTIKDSLFDGADRTEAIQFNLTSSVSNSFIQNYKMVNISMTGNTFLNAIAEDSSLASGVIFVHADEDNFAFEFKDNWIYEGDDSNASSTTALIYGEGYNTNAATADYASAYSIIENRFIIKNEGNLPVIFTASTESTGHNNVNVGGNFAEVNGVVVAPITNESINRTTNKPVSYTKYYYLDVALTQSSCQHINTTTNRVNSSCAEQGYEDTICIDCNKIVRHEVLPLIDHIPSTWQTEVAATCTTDGSEYQYCTVCLNTVATRVAEATGHDNGKWKTTIEPTCTTEGLRSRLCSACLEPLEHKAVPVIDHSYDVINTVESTCDMEGMITKECVSCHDIINEPIAKKLHVAGNWQVITEANCESGAYGERVILCTGCDYEMASEAIEPTHTLEWETYIPATETTYGIEFLTCTICGERVDGRVIMPLLKDATYKFEDIKSGDWFVKNGAIDFVYTLGLFEGTGETTFSPNAPMTRAMFVTVVGRLSGADVDHNAPSHFKDVQPGKWYSGYVVWAFVNGIIDGTGYDTFSPNNNITREQMCKILVDYCDSKTNIIFELPAVEDEIKFKDHSRIASWAKKYVTVCQRAGIINGRSDGTFDPKGNATRAEVAAIIMRLIEANM